MLSGKYTQNKKHVRRLVFRHEFVNFPHSTLRKLGLFVAGAEVFRSEPLSHETDTSIFRNINQVSLALIITIW